MSGGSWDYAYQRVQDVADRFRGSRDATRRAFGEHLAKCAEAMRVVEWVDSGDSTSPADTDAIRALLGPAPIVAEIKAEAERLLGEVQRLAVSP